jgi:hypothetical protein
MLASHLFFKTHSEPSGFFGFIERCKRTVYFLNHFSLGSLLSAE